MMRLRWGRSVLLYEPYFSCVEHAAPRYRTEGFTAAARGRQDASLPEPGPRIRDVSMPALGHFRPISAFRAMSHLLLFAADIADIEGRAFLLCPSAFRRQPAPQW